MAVRKNVFGSNTERTNYDKLKTMWDRDYDLYPNLPFLMVFQGTTIFDLNVFPPTSEELSGKEYDRLKKTSIDYTLCSKAGEPIICVDFDGLQEGHNVGTSYRPKYPSDPWRDEMIRLKLRVAHGNLFPYFVVGSRQFSDLTREARLTIVDGVIGEVLAKRYMSRRFAQGFDCTEMGWSKEDFAMMSDYEQREILENWGVGVEVEAIYTLNPIYQRVAALSDELGTHGCFKRFLETAKGKAAKSSAERVKFLNERSSIGAECILHTKDLGDIRGAVWIPNFRTPEFTGLGLVQEIAHLIALTTYKRQRASVKTVPA
jgi:hypothetical protein